MILRLVDLLVAIALRASIDLTLVAYVKVAVTYRIMFLRFLLLNPTLKWKILVILNNFLKLPSLAVLFSNRACARSIFVRLVLIIIIFLS
jgi:hypothetical protein